MQILQMSVNAAQGSAGKAVAAGSAAAETAADAAHPSSQAVGASTSALLATNPAAGNAGATKGVWKRYVKNGIPFYHNKVLNKSTWRLPRGAVVAGDDHQEPHHVAAVTESQKEQQQQQQSMATAQSRASVDTSHLPAASSQSVAFINHQVRNCTTKHPSASTLQRPQLCYNWLLTDMSAARSRSRLHCFCIQEVTMSSTVDAT
jgi:hypothetical protein